MNSNTTHQAKALELEALGPLECLRWAIQTFDRPVLASSFGAEDMVLIDMLCRLTTQPQIFYLDTGLLFPETYALIQAAQSRYGFEAIRVATKLSLDEQAATWGEALWKSRPDQCCRLRKVEPLARFLKGQPAWITGIRRDQTPARANAQCVEWDDTFKLVKINPLVAWTSEQVFDYLRSASIPYNPLHDQGYPSIGCVPCTRPVQPGEDPRAGRWPGQEKTECGLHLPE